MLSIPTTLATDEATDYQPLLDMHSRYGKTIDIEGRDLTPKMVAAITSAAHKMGETGIARVTEAIAAAREGDTNRPIPRLPAFPEMLVAYLREHLADGWLYRKGPDGHLHAWLVTDVAYHEANHQRERPIVSVSLTATGSHGSRREAAALGPVRTSMHFSGQEVSRKRVADVLTNAGCYVETPALRADYDEALATYTEVLAEGFSEQYRFSGKPMAEDDNYYRTPTARHGAKVVHDLHADEVQAPGDWAESILFGEADEAQVDDSKPAPKKARRHGEAMGVGPVPVHFALRVFDLGKHEFLWVNTRDVERYVYDPTLAEKIVLPADQRNLLDILTTNLDDFTGDVIEGKSAGNVVLCKGAPGVGKTLTAEVYSELIERPLYSIHSGNLGTNAESVRKALEVVFERALRWNAVLLLDEADVFVLERGSNITQNAIVAEFLRTLEYFTGLMFMTTNRADNIDDAILSRAAAIIDYALPDVEGIRDVWLVQARNQGADLPEGLLDDLVHGFAHIAPRDVKMLLRLALRVAKGNGHALDVETFARCAMFRGLHFEKGSRP